RAPGHTHGPGHAAQGPPPDRRRREVAGGEGRNFRLSDLRLPTRGGRMSDEKEQLKLHHLQPAPGSKKSKIRVGRGESGKRGKTAGRGTKGLKARGSLRPGFEGGQTPLSMRLPKLPGFKNLNKEYFAIVNLVTL